jgi:general glycosylation pathway protein
MKILFFTTNIKNGGSERYLSTLDKFLSATNETKIFYFGENSELFSFKSPIEKLDVKTGDAFLAETNRRLKIRNCVKSEDPDLIISLGESANVDLAFSIMSLNKKLILTEQSKKEDEKSGSFKTMAYKKADFLTVLNRAEFDKFDFMKENRKIIYSPFDLPSADFSKKEKIILSVGRLEKIKGYENYIKALSMISNSIKDGWEIVLCGSGSLEPRLRDLALSLGVSVSFLGFRNDISYYYSKASIVALPSLKETLPNSLIESIYFDCARFATPTDGAKELINSGKDGVLSTDFTPKAMKDALEALMTSEAARLKYAYESRKLKEKFSIEIFNKSWLEVINRVVNAK